MAEWMWKSISGGMEVRMAYKREVDDVDIMDATNIKTNRCTCSRKSIHPWLNESD
jgi:hypothetical protein